MTWPLEKDEAFNEQPSDGGRRTVECDAGRPRASGRGSGEQQAWEQGAWPWRLSVCCEAVRARLRSGLTQAGWLSKAWQCLRCHSEQYRHCGPLSFVYCPVDGPAVCRVWRWKVLRTYVYPRGTLFFGADRSAQLPRRWTVLQESLCVLGAGHCAGPGERWGGPAWPVASGNERMGWSGEICAWQNYQNLVAGSNADVCLIEVFTEEGVG